MYTLALVRHGESVMNKENRFCGWIDVDLSPTGESEAISAAESLKEANLKFGYLFTSALKRAIDTSKIILKYLNQDNIPSESTWRLNERHYGSLQGLNKLEVVDKYGEDLVKLWRRSYDIPPPPCDVTSEYYPGNNPKYDDIPRDQIPNGESLKLTMERVVPFWISNIAPELKKGLPVLIVAHGNSLRALVKHLVKMTDEEMLDFNIPTAVPMVLELNEDLTLKSKRFLLDEEELKAKMEAVAAQAKKKHKNILFHCNFYLYVYVLICYFICVTII